MTHARQQHPNAVLTPTGRCRMVACVIEDRWSIEATAERFQVDAKTVRKWRDRFLAEGDDGLRDRTGYRFIHTALDDRTRLAYSEIHADEQAVTAAAFWRRANAWFLLHGITVERVLTDNGSCYRSKLWLTALAETGVTPKRTRPYRPQTNGKVERFHRILLEEWAYIRDWHSDQQRTAAYTGFIHFYNRHRSHGALGWSTPANTLNRLLRDNLPSFHS